MKTFKKVICGIALASLAMGAGVAAMSHFSSSKLARADVVTTEPTWELHLEELKIKGYTEHHLETMVGHDGVTETTAYVFSAEGDTSPNPEIRFVTEGTQTSSKPYDLVAYAQPVTTVRFWYKLTNTSEKNVSDGSFPYLLQVLATDGKYPLINWQPVADGLWHSWCMEVPTAYDWKDGNDPVNYQDKFAGFIVKMGDINGQLAIADAQLNVTAEANQIGYFEITKFSSWNCFDNANEMLFMQTTGTDFPDTSVYNVSVNVDILNNVGFYADLKAVNDPFYELVGGQSYLNYWVRPGVLTFMPANSRVYTTINFPEGLRFPSYNYIQNGVPTYYALKDAMIANRVSDEHPTDKDVRWSLERQVDESLILGDFAISKIQSYRAYTGDPANGNEQVLVWVSGTDYIDVDGEGSMQQHISDDKFPNIAAKFFYGSSADPSVCYLPNILSGECYFNFTTRHPLFSFAPEGVLNIDRIIFKAGLLIPSYDYISGGPESYYRLSADVAYARLESNTDLYAFNLWKIDRPGEDLGEWTFYNCQWCGTSNEGWGNGLTFIILKINETTMFGDFEYNVNYTAYVSEEYYLNKIKVNGKFLSEFDSSELLEAFRANAIGQNQFGIIFVAGFTVEDFELLPGCRFPAQNTVDYHVMNQHLIKSVHSPIFNAEELNAFGDTYMHPEIEESDIGTGLCASEGWYATAKAAFMGMDEYKRAVMYDYPEHYGWVLTRLAAWARANGDSLQGWNIVDGAHRITPAQQNVAINISIIVVCASISLVAGVAILLTIKKRKHQR